MTHYEVILPRRAHPQPRPAIVAIGDCGACVVGGLTGLSVSDVYDRLRRTREAFWWEEMRATLSRAQDVGLLDRLISDVPIWPVREAHAGFGWRSIVMGRQWLAYVRMALDAGYYGIADVDLSKQGGPPDHYVLICGMRFYWEPNESGGASGRSEVLVSCSAHHPDGRWVDAHEFQKSWGGFNVQLARPS